MKKLLGSSILVLLSVGFIYSTMDAPSLTDAESAFQAHDLKKASAIWERLVAAPDTRPEDKAKAQWFLARLDWWFYSKPDAARERLLRAAEAGAEASMLLCELAKVETSLARYKEARIAAQRAVQASKKIRDRRNARLKLAEATVTEAQNARLAGKAVPDPRGLVETVALLSELMAQEPGVLEIARPLLCAALMTGDGPAAWKAWKAYFHVAPGAEVPALLKIPMTALQGVLPAWKGGPLPTDGTAAVVQALSDSRLFPEAAVLLRDPALPESLRLSFSPLLAYHDYIRAMKIICDDYYRKTALGQGSEETFLGTQFEELRSRWTSLGLPGTADTGDFRTLGKIAFSVLEARYGSLVYFGQTAGYFDLHMGHLITDELRTIEQYGKTARIRYQVLDTMVSNGFQSWAWCFMSQHGGWSSGETIVNVRTDEAAVILARLRKATDPEERKEWDERIARESKEDEVRAAKNPYSYLPGLAGRLRRSVLDEALAELDKKGIHDPEERILSIIAANERETENCIIFAHEGRHALDAAMGIKDLATLEFNAKLSEIAFSEHPKGMLGQVNSPDLGNPTPHGQGALKIVKGLVAWMAAHAAEIRGFDAERPVMPQIDALTDEQMRLAIRSMDPLLADLIK